MRGSSVVGETVRWEEESIAAYRVVPTLAAYLQTARVMQIGCGGDHTAAILEKKM